MEVHVVSYEVPEWGVGELYLHEGRVLHHDLPAAREAHGDAMHGLADRLLGYFAGQPAEFGDVELDLEWATPFQRACAEALRSIPWGEIVTYGELAALAGHPNAHRAAGTFCAGNRFPILVPCHRVVAAGSLGSYGSLGLEYKRRLLELEGAV